MRVLFFAQTKDAAGAPELELKISGTLGLDEIWQVLISMSPALAPLRPCTRLACNGEYTNAKTIFCDTDEVALIPPVSGG